MLQNSISVKNRHQKFIDEITNTEIVWSLANAEGFATSSSNEFEDEEGEPIGMICFWSDEKLAKVCAKNDWGDYIPKEIRIEEFMENWCIGMHNDNLMIGTNFDWNMFGFEIDPLELIVEITEKLRMLDKSLVFQKFEGIEDLETQVKEIINEDY